MSYALTFQLACGHVVSWGWGYEDLVTVERKTPRRRDGTFGAVHCPVCRRRRRIAVAKALLQDAGGLSAREVAPAGTRTEGDG